MSVPSVDQPTYRLPVSFEIKSAQLAAVALMLKTGNLDALVADFERQFGSKGESPDFFDHDAVVLDFSQLDTDTPAQDLAPLMAVLRTCRLQPIAVRGASAAWMVSARALGLVEVPTDTPRMRPEVATPEPPETVTKEVLRVVPGPPTMVIDRPLRSGQKIYARGADLVILAMVNQGAEVVADGNIHVYAPLRGKAMAGASGNTQARIFSLSLEPELISIAGVYRTSENPLSPEVQGKAAQVRLSNDGMDKLLFEALNP